MKTEYTISKERHDEICKLELEAIKERDSLRADNDHLRQDNNRLKGELAKLQVEYDGVFTRMTDYRAALQRHKSCLEVARGAFQEMLEASKGFQRIKAYRKSYDAIQQINEVLRDSKPT